jgi:hypothetical protein
VDFGWANEIKPAFESHDDGVRNYLALTVWPGNTKGQGWKIYRGSLDWTTRDNLGIRGRNYSLVTTFYIKFCHFSAFVSGFNFTLNDLIDPERPIHTKNNYDHQSGLWRREDWTELQAFFDNHLKSEFDWREKALWEEKFAQKHGRTELTVSFGWQVTLWVPFAEIAVLDTTLDDPGPAAALLNNLIEGMRRLIE